MGLGNFTTSVLGMTANSHAIEQIGKNVANMTTTGYKAIDTQFKSFVDDENFPVMANGVQTVDRQFMGVTGNILPSQNNLHVAINNPVGMFMATYDVAGNEEPYFTRAGDFVPIEAAEGQDQYYLGTASGLYVQGFMANDDGTYSDDLSAIMVTPPSEIEGTPTTHFDIGMNLPASGSISENIGVSVYDSNIDQHLVSVYFDKTDVANQWTLNFRSDELTVVSPALDEQSVTFSLDGDLLTPTEPVTLQVEYPTGETADITFDMSGLTQFAGVKNINYIEQDGVSNGNIVTSAFNENGEYIARYSNGMTVSMAKLAIVDFPASQNLEAVSGNLFQYRSDAGDMRVLNAPGEATDLSLKVQSLEMSNVNLEDQFSKMITVQNAYSSNSQAFQTQDEMVEAVIDLKT